MNTPEQSDHATSSDPVPSDTNDSSTSTNTIDFSSEISTSPLPTLNIEPYDPRPHEDAARRRIAYGLIGLLSVTIIAMLLMVCCHAIAVVDLKEFAVILGPLVTLVSAATGFYYGTKTTSN
ncbi:MAG: hypothetical protein RLY58_118 [Pseudomonadota bacterium]|jgi:hypothetical protein